MVHKEELAIAELIGNCEFMNSEQIAKLQLTLEGWNLDKLAEIVREQGIINAGDEYDSEYNRVMESQLGIS